MYLVDRSYLELIRASSSHKINHHKDQNNDENAQEGDSDSHGHFLVVLIGTGHVDRGWVCAVQNTNLAAIPGRSIGSAAGVENDRTLRLSATNFAVGATTSPTGIVRFVPCFLVKALTAVRCDARTLRGGLT